MSNGIWIRPQDKNRLISCEHIYITPNGIIRGVKGDDDVCIGVYKNRERAIEILDDIEKALCFGTHIGKSVWENNLTMISINVFDMPES
jgi:hypothetical protein